MAVKVLPHREGPSRPVTKAEPYFTGVRLEGRMGSGTLGTTWRAELADGSAVAVKRLATRGRNTSARLERLQRAAQLRNSNLVELLSIFQEEDRFWVASRLDDGVPLSRLLKKGRLRAAFAVAVGMGVLSALTSLHHVGLSHGAIHARNVHVGRDGTVRLGDYGLSSAPSGQSPAARRAADVRAVGTLLCSLLGVPADPAGGSRASRRSKVAESPLGAAVRAIATYRRKLPPGHEAIHASLTLWEAARGMATARRQAQTRDQLARMVAMALGTDPGVTLRLVGATQPAPARTPATTSQPVSRTPPPPGRESARAPTFLTGLVALLVTILAVGFMDAVLAPTTPIRSASAAPANTPSVGARRAQVARPQPAPPPPAPPSPVLPPTSAGDVRALTLRYETPVCEPGSVCHVRVDLAIQPSRAVHPLTWTVYSIDACTGELTPLGIAGATVLTGWTRVVGDSFPRVPAGRVSRLVAITDGPARASSAPVALTAPSGCAG